MVGDDDLQPALARIRDGFVSGDAGIARQQQVRGVAVDLRGQRLHPDAVQFAQAIGDVEIHERAVAAKAIQQQGGRGLAVDIEVTPDQDALSGFNGSAETRYCCGHVR